MKIKTYGLRAIFYLCLSVMSLFFSGCIKGNEEYIVSGESAIMDFNVSTTKVGDNALGSNEVSIKTFRLFVFHNTDGLADDQKLIIEGGKIHETSFLDNTITLNRKIENVKKGKYALYIMINEPPALKDVLNAVVNLGDVKGLDYLMATHFNNIVGYRNGKDVFTDGAFSLPMHFTEVFEISSFSTVRKECSVERTLARVDLNLKNEGLEPMNLKGGTLTIANTHPTAGYPNDASDVTVELGGGVIQYPNDVDVLLTHEYMRAFSFYTPARPCVANKISVTLTNILKADALTNYPAIILDKVKIPGGIVTEELKRLDRNTIYAIQGVFGVEGFTTAVSVTRGSWDDAILDDVIIPGTYLYISVMNVPAWKIGTSLRVFYKTDGTVTTTNTATFGTVTNDSGNKFDYTGKAVGKDVITVKTGNLSRTVTINNVN